MSTAIAPPITLTYEEFLAGDYDGVKAEWVEGAVLEMSPESSDHQKVTRFLLNTISIFVEAINSASSVSSASR